MILPCPETPFPPQRHPLTWTVLCLNIFLFVLIFSSSDRQVGSAVRDITNQDLEVSGELYLQYMEGLEKAELATKPLWVQQVQRNNVEQLQVLGAYSIRDQLFLEYAKNHNFYGDDIAIADWRAHVNEYINKYKNQVVSHFGLSSLTSGNLSWVTYQFSHANFFHLLSNMIFLIFIGSAVEATIGSFALILIYLCGGFAGGLFFLMMDAHGMAPVVGASASISALLAFYCLFEDRRRIRYFYFISPFVRQNGFIYLPTLLIVPMFIISDLTSLNSSPEGLAGGVAYSAHLGGTVFGSLLAIIMRFGFSMKREFSVLDIGEPAAEKIKPIRHDDDF